MSTLAELALAATLRERLPDLLEGSVAVIGLARLLAPLDTEDYHVEIEVSEGPHAGRHAYILHGERAGHRMGSLRRAEEYRAIQAAQKVGVRVPAAPFLLPDLFDMGADAFFSVFLPGAYSGHRVVHQPGLDVARARLPLQIAESLASLHQITPGNEPELSLFRPPFVANHDPVEATLVYLRQLLEALPCPRPALEYALRWLRLNPPVSRELALVHGDLRPQCLLVTLDGLAGIVHWGQAHWGNPLADLAMLMLREGRYGRLELPVGGFADLETFLSAYVDLSGRPIRPADLHWWQIAGNVRRGAETVASGRFGPRDDLDLEILTQPRRAAEFEFEALRLIEVGP